MSRRSVPAIADELVMSKIHTVRGRKVMLDRDLAELYGVSTRRLKEQVRRNIERFPPDFMFEMTPSELADWRSQFATSNREVMGLRIPPFCFTEHGVLMLSSVLNSEAAIAVNIQIIRVFTRMREMLMTHKDLLLEVERIRTEVTDHGKQLELIFSYLKQLEERQQEEDKGKDRPPRKPIGYRKEV